MKFVSAHSSVHQWLYQVMSDQRRSIPNRPAIIVMLIESLTIQLGCAISTVYVSGTMEKELTDVCR